MSKKQIIANEDTVVAYTDKGTMVEWKMGQLKQAFLEKKLKYRVLFVYFPKKKKYFKITYYPTKGFKFVEHDPTKATEEDYE
jgi:hypothetical protein